MKYLVTITILLIAQNNAFGQLNYPHEVRAVSQKSHLKLIYKVPADSMYRWAQTSNINIPFINSIHPFLILPDSANLDSASLPNGQYIVVNSQREWVNARWRQVTQTGIAFTQSLKQNRLLVYAENEQPTLSANVRFMNAWLKKNYDWNGYEVPEKKWEEAWILVATPGDTLITQIEQEEEYRYNYNRGLKNKPIIGPIIRLPKNIQRIFNGQPNYNKRKKIKDKHRTKGYVLFSQAVYKPGDTLKCKAWLTDGKENPFTKPQEVSISYMKQGKWTTSSYGTLLPLNPGSYVFSTPLPDSFPSDTRYTITFKGPKKHTSFNSNFKIEDYKLPDISKFTWESEKDEYLTKDTLHLTAEATDASGLPLLDASIEILLLTNRIFDWQGDTLFVPDTLYQFSQKMNTNGATKISVPLTDLPKADMYFTALGKLRNSSNEIIEKTKDIRVYQNKQEIRFLRTGDSLLIRWMENDISKPAKAILTLENDNWEKDTIITLPCHVAWHPLAEVYRVEILNGEGGIIKEDTYEGKEETGYSFKPLVFTDFKKDSVGFVLRNPGKEKVFLTIHAGKQNIWEGTTNQTTFSWYNKATENKMFRLKYTYIQDGESHEEKIDMGLPYKWLKVQTETNPVVQPGSNDTLHIKVTDYKDNPAGNINISAVAHNMQLSSQLQLPNLPLVHNYKNTKFLKNPNLIQEDYSSVNSKEPLSQFANIRKHLGTDTMPYYGWLFSNQAVIVRRSIIKNPLSEMAVHVQRNGVPESIITLYVNNRPAWHYRINSSHVYSHEILPGYVKIGVRTRDALYTLDSMYMQPYYKHDVFLNLDSLVRQKNTTYNPMPDTLKMEEIIELTKYFIRFENHNDNRDAIIWQSNRIHKLSGYNNDWIVGPFENYYPINAWKDRFYNTTFPMESGFSYRISQSLVRMEKTPLFSSNPKMKKEHGRWIVGEQIPNDPLPPLKTEKEKPPLLTIDPVHYYTKKSYSTAQIQIDADSLNFWQIWIPEKNPKNFRVSAAGVKIQHELEPGIYRVLLVKFDGRTADLGLYGLQPNGTNCFHWKDPIFGNKIPITDSLIVWQKRKSQPTTKLELPKNDIQPNTYIRKGESGLNGYVKDKNDDIPIPGAIVSIKGSNVSTLTDDNGYYEFSGIGSGEYTLEISLVGYQSLQQEIKLKQNEILTTNFLMQISEQALEEVVVVGYGISVKKSYTGSLTTVIGSDISQTLEGSVAGVSVTENGNGNEIKIRGISTLNGNNQPLYVIDGIIMEDMPENLDTTLGNISIEVLKDAAATSLYGSRGANGVILINTGRNVASSLRMNFSDYAYWQPNFTTGKDGSVKIPISYPDNITNWQHAVYAAGPKGRYGRSITSTKAFKSVQGLLNTPGFLVEGDSSLVVGKAMNYSDAPVNIETNFAIHETNRFQTMQVPAMDAITSEYSLIAPSAPDTIKPSFSVKDAKGRTDGEQRAIPVLPMGTYESEGKFFSLSSTDTSFYFSPTYKNLPVQVMATAKLIDLVEHELKSLIEYPYDCLEQTANKLWGLLMLKEIASLKNQSFKYERKMSPLLNKLLSNQDKSGGWAWWPGGEPNLYITVKVLQVLRQYPQNEKNEKAIRGGNLYLQNLLPRLGRFDKIEALYSLKEGGHVMPYKMAIDSIPFDSLPVHQQWQFFYVMRGHQPSYDSLWQNLWPHRTESATGATFWGNQSYLWYENKNATMVVAWKTILSDSSRHHLLPSMQKYFLELQYDGLNNTVEKAEICNILLKEAVRKGEFSDVEPKLRFNDKEEMTSFPAFLQLSPDGKIKVEKSGYGLLYLTMYQKWQNKAPQKVDALFDVKTTFTQYGDTLNFLKSANSATIHVAIEAKKEAQFVMVEIPLPAGCVVTQKSQYPLQHREYYKDRVVIFMEKLEKGPHFFNIPIDVRYKGAYTLNPAKVELMYQPVFYGREGLRRIAIE